MNQKPLGLVVLGVMAGLGGSLMALVLVSLDYDTTTDLVLVRGAAAALAAASLVAAEALVRVRPWFYHASLGLSLTWNLVGASGTIASFGLAGIVPALVFIGISLVFLLPVMVYIRDEWDRLRLVATRVATPPRAWPVPGRAA
jgi:hypothetical protein